MKSIYIDGIEYKPYDENYFVSNRGNVYSKYSNKILKNARTKDGHYRVDIHRMHKMVHRLVYECWVGPVPENLQVNHRDDDKENNSLSNLYAGTQQENIQDCTSNRHRAGNISTLIVKEKSSQRILGSSPAKNFIEYSGHTSTNGSIKRILTRDWFINAYEVIFFGKGVTTNPDECKEVEWIMPPLEARRI